MKQLMCARRRDANVKFGLLAAEGTITLFPKKQSPLIEAVKILCCGI